VDKEPLNDFMSLKEFCKKYSTLASMGRIRWLLFKSSETGADFFVRRIGRKILVSPTLFFQWIEENKFNQQEFSYEKTTTS